MVAGARVRHTGAPNMGAGAEDSWKPFTSDQVVVTQRPDFDWDGRVAMMLGLPVQSAAFVWRMEAVVDL